MRRCAPIRRSRPATARAWRRRLRRSAGAWPKPKSLAWRGSWGGIDYRIKGVFEVGAEPSQSPYSTNFDEHAIPRIRTTPPGVGEQEWGSSWWLDILKDHPERRYVSDGDPAKITFPKSLAGDLAPRFEPEANPTD